MTVQKLGFQWKLHQLSKTIKPLLIRQHTVLRFVRLNICLFLIIRVNRRLSQFNMKIEIYTNVGA